METGGQSRNACFRISKTFLFSCALSKTEHVKNTNQTFHIWNCTRWNCLRVGANHSIPSSLSLFLSLTYIYKFPHERNKEILRNRIRPSEFEWVVFSWCFSRFLCMCVCLSSHIFFLLTFICFCWLLSSAFFKRCFRDERRFVKKYHQFWLEHCKVSAEKVRRNDKTTQIWRNSYSVLAHKILSRQR